MKVFLSYADRNKEDAETIRTHLRNDGIDCFMAGMDVQAGERWERRLKLELQESVAVIFLITPQSVNRQWVIREWGAAWVLDKPIFPLRLDMAAREVPEGLRQHQILRFDQLAQLPEQIRQAVTNRGADPETRNQEERLIDQISGVLTRLIRRRLGSGDTVYEERSDHYREEKEQLARCVVDTLERRVQHLRDAGKERIRIFIGSGTTVAPILEEMASRAQHAARKGEPYWLSRTDDGVEVVTNNIRGLQHLLRYRVSTEKPGTVQAAEDRYAEIPFRCTVLPGGILAVYQAIADENTIRALLYMAQEPAYNISLLTGNYIVSSADGYLIPVARAGFHPEIKATLYTISDEVHVVAPLGKVILGNRTGVSGLKATLWSLNQDLAYTEKSPLQSAQPYELVEKRLVNQYFRDDTQKGKYKGKGIPSWAAKTVLVTTRRIQGEHVFHPYFSSLERLLDPYSPTHAIPLRGGPFIQCCDFKELPWSKGKQIEAEIPHENLRQAELVQKYFGIDLQREGA